MYVVFGVAFLVFSSPECWASGSDIIDGTSKLLVGGVTDLENRSEEAHADKFFLDKIFDKYGDEGVINFEGFEHLLDSLGLGGGLFQAPHELDLHRVNGSFKQIHDSEHRHKRHAVSKQSAELKAPDKQCLSPHDILQLYGLDQPGATAINPKIFLNMCPALVYQLDQRTCFVVETAKNEIEDVFLAWVYALGSVFIISAIGLLGALLVPVMQSVIFSQLLQFLVALAIGTLCGDAMLHLLPHSLEQPHNSKHHDHTAPIFKCSVTLLTILLFYSVESIMRIMTGNTGAHGHSHVPDKVREIEHFELGVMVPDTKTKKKKPMAPVALMVILGDAIHNVTDGLAIGAAFSNDIVTGFATALAVFCHELPHELGDFAVLIRSGMSTKKAIYCNLLSSILSFVGTAIGLWLGEEHVNSSKWIYAATAGTFLYIALADLIPEIINNNSGKFLDFWLNFIGIVMGFIIMLTIALFEDDLKLLLDK